jgi:hypothetical protein
VLAVAFAFRLWRLDSLPGINGDEAWYGVQMLNLASGQPFLWKTPPGNILNPFYSGLVLLLQLPFAPHFWILRGAAVISSVLAVAACARLWRRFLSPDSTRVAALLFATLPVTIAYARFGWDASQSILAGVLTLAFVMLRRWMMAALFFVIGVWVHPTNIFLAPLVFVHLLYEQPVRQAQGWPVRMKQLAVRLAGALAVVALARYLFVPASVQITPAALMARLASGDAWWEFTRLFGRLLSGTTSYAYIVGQISPANQLLHDVVFWLLIAMAFAFGIGGIFSSRDHSGRAQVLGTLLTYVVFFTFAGPPAISPHFERYALVLVAPAVLTFVLLLGHAFERCRLTPYLTTTGVALAVACLLSFSINYLAELSATGGRSHRTFRTAAREPKQTAFALILERSARQRTCAGIHVAAEDWWLYWPLRYLSLGTPRIAVSMADERPTDQFMRATDGCSYYVGFAGGPFQPPPTSGFDSQPIADPLGRPILLVWHARAPSPP